MIKVQMWVSLGRHVIDQTVELDIDPSKEGEGWETLVESACADWICQHVESGWTLISEEGEDERTRQYRLSRES